VVTGGLKPMRKSALKAFNDSMRWRRYVDRTAPYTSRCLDEMSELYGIDRGEIISQIDEIKKVRWVPYLLDAPMWDRVYAVDDC